MELVIGGVFLIVVLYLWRNGKRNSDPLNRKAAAEICKHIVATAGTPDLDEVVSILMKNARYRKDARHIASMVPALLVGGGIPHDMARSVHGPLLQAANTLPN